MHTFCVRYHKRWRWDRFAANTGGERFIESRVERVAGLGHTLSLVTVAGSLPIRKSIYLFGGGGICVNIFTSPIRNCLSNCAYVLRASGTDLPQTRTESDSSRAELRESRDLHTIASPASYVPTLHTRVLSLFALCQKCCRRLAEMTSDGVVRC